MIYRIWMACRRRDAKAWRRSVQGGETLGATEKAWVTRVTDELAEAAGDQTVTAFLDCSKCYERVPHRLAARRALELGAPPRLMQMLFDMHRAPRRVRVHGAVSDIAVGHCGLPAGCAYAKDVLEGFLRPMAAHCSYCVFRGYVDDATLQAVHATARGAAACLGRDLCQVKQALREDTMVLNDAKEQILGPTAAVRAAWTALWPEYQGACGPTGQGFGGLPTPRGGAKPDRGPEGCRLSEIWSEDPPVGTIGGRWPQYGTLLDPGGRAVWLRSGSLDVDAVLTPGFP